ncbi:phasin family protein [Sphingomonas sp. Tas61C01]|uniref:phasin family protein n=1 Tax=Sphingomonas sp. Tas61C01 TaxID=3458297 RepID=UPI00403EEAA8
MADDVNDAIDQGANAAKSAAETMRNAGEQARTGFNERVVDPAKRAGEAIKASGQKVAEGGATIGTKMIDQAEQNAREAFAAMREAASAKDISDVMRIQGDYLREQGQRSMSQAREIGELIMQFGRDAVAPLRSSGEK